MKSNFYVPLFLIGLCFGCSDARVKNKLKGIWYIEEVKGFKGEFMDLSIWFQNSKQCKLPVLYHDHVSNSADYSIIKEDSGLCIEFSGQSSLCGKYSLAFIPGGADGSEEKFVLSTDTSEIRFFKAGD